MPTTEEALEYIGIDYPDALILKNVERAMATARGLVRGGVGGDVYDLMADDSRVKELTLIYTDDLYSNKGVSAKVSGSIRRLVADMEQQLRLELVDLREAVV